ncbi:PLASMODESMATA CALLOSE-BINDING PROTEIN 3 [Canna indica]|uniref:PLASMODESMATA CALLOSE-BINDING PROTEIN 3 n=1 Tax=Canna indica TaxID=4628 RepID=A0AAQ3Q747_9LILI|nr:PLASMODESMATA CALLOSE-BINDING PROTEIN 3 [Canna indica]
MAPAILLLMLTATMFSGSDGAWCVCRSDVGNSALQKALDYACGAGADCTPILQNGACFNPNTVLAHCSYAANSYYQRKGQAQGACDFSGSATLTSTDPGGNGCTYPATPSAAGTSSTPTSTGTTTTPSSTTPSTFTPNTGIGGMMGGLGPSGTTNSFDGSDAGLLPRADMAFLLTALLLSSLFLLRRDFHMV